MNVLQTKSSRRQFLSAATVTAGAAVMLRHHALWAAADVTDGRVTDIVAKIFSIDTHNHIDVPLTDAEMPGPDLDLAGEMKRSGLSAICMTFATNYQPGDAYDRFLKGLSSLDRQLDRNHMKRSLTPEDIRSARNRAQPMVIQAVEGGHFLQGRVERLKEAYDRGLRQLGLLHDTDATVPLGDVYTNPSRFGGLTAFGTSVIKECNQLGIVIDLAHANAQTTEAALKVSTKPVVCSHTGLDTQLGNNPRTAQMMRPRLISKEQAKTIALAGGAVGVWTHLADNPLDYARNIRAMADVIGIDHVIIGTDSKLTPPGDRPVSFPSGGVAQPGNPQTETAHPNGPSAEGPRPDQRQPRVGERTNLAWPGETAGFCYVVVDAMLKTGFTPDEIEKVCGGNFLRIFGAAVRP